MELIASKGVARERIMYVPNAISETLIETFRSDDEEVDKSRATVAYVGLLGYPQGMGVLLEAAQALPNVDFVLVGDGPERESLQARAEGMQLANVLFTGS